MSIARMKKSSFCKVFALSRVPCARFSQGTLPRAFVVLAVVLMAPEFVHAQSWVDELVREAAQAAEGRGGTVIIENHSSVSTGGKVAGSGESVVTDGDVSASSRSETHINIGANGGEAKVKIETSRNGETETREYEKKVEAGDPLRLDVSARTDENGSVVEVITENASGTKEVVEESGAPTDSPESSVFMDRFEQALKSVPTFFSRVFGFLWGW